MKFIKYFLILFLFSGCGLGTVTTVGVGSGNGSGTSLSVQEKIFVAASFNGDLVGSIATVGANNPHLVAAVQAVTDSDDLVVKGYENKLFIVNRGSASVQVLNPADFTTLGNYSVGSGGNPQDLVLSNGRAYISRLDAHLDSDNKDDVWCVDPLTGNIIKTFDLTPYTDNDGDRLARAAKMESVGDNLFVLLQDLSIRFKADTRGKVVVINTVTNIIVASIPLSGRNPTAIRYEPTLDQLFITDTGPYDDSFNTDPGNAFGGIETVNPNDFSSAGIVMDDALFGGALSSVEFVSSSLGVVTVDATIVATFNPSTLAVVNSTLYTSSGPYLPELLVDANGFVWVPERNVSNAGLLQIDPTSGGILAGPLGVGALPTSMTLIP